MVKFWRQNATESPFYLKSKGHCIFGFVKWDLSHIPHHSTNSFLPKRLHSKYCTLYLRIFIVFDMFNIHSRKIHIIIYFHIEFVRHVRLISVLLYYSFAKQFGHPKWQGYGSYIHWWSKRYGIINKAVCCTKKSAPAQEELENCKRKCLVSCNSRVFPPGYLQWWRNSSVLQVLSPQNLLLRWWQGHVWHRIAVNWYNCCLSCCVYPVQEWNNPTWYKLNMFVQILLHPKRKLVHVPLHWLIHQHHCILLNLWLYPKSQ